MPPRAWSKKRERQYEHIEQGLEERGRSPKVAKEIAARTVNKERARAGEIEKATREAPKEPTKEPTAPPQSAAGGPITSIAAELRELASLRDAGILTQQEFEEQKKRLLPS